MGVWLRRSQNEVPGLSSVQHEAPGLSLPPQIQEGVSQNSRLREGCAYIRHPPPHTPAQMCSPGIVGETPTDGKKKEPRSCQVMPGLRDLRCYSCPALPWLLRSPTVATPSHSEVSSMDTPTVDAPYVLRWPWWTSLPTYGHSHES